MPHRFDDLDFWNQEIAFHLPLWIAMALHGYACLGLRHPETQDGAMRPAVVRAVRRLGDLLVERRALSRDELAGLERLEQEAGGLRPDEPGWPGGPIP